MLKESQKPIHVLKFPMLKRAPITNELALEIGKEVLKRLKNQRKLTIEVDYLDQERLEESEGRVYYD